MVTTIRRGTGSSSMLSPEPSQGSSSRAVASRSMILVLGDAGELARYAGGFGERRLHVEAFGRLDLDRRLARDLVLPDRCRVADQRHAAEGQAGQEGHDGDDADQRPAGDVVRRDDGRRLALDALLAGRFRGCGGRGLGLLRSAMGSSIIDVEPAVGQDHAARVDLLHQAEIVGGDHDGGAAAGSAR